MERLTIRTPAGVANLDYPQNCFYPDGTKDQVAVSAYRQKAIDRLAAYEDTGLEPEEVIHIKHALMGKVLAEIKEFEGISLDRMKELAQAEHDGLLVVLPEVPERDRKSFINGLQDYFQEASFCDPSTGIFGMSEGEKEIATTLMNALTREQAETALKKREEN